MKRKELSRPVGLVAASFPCIDLSLAGKRKGLAGGHSGAFWAFVGVLKSLRESGDAPRAVMIENVVGFLSSNDGEDFREALSALNELGYRLDIVQVTAERFTPQSRPRVFVLGLLEEDARDVMTLPEEVSAEDWAAAVNAGGDVRPRIVRQMMLGETRKNVAVQTSILGKGDPMLHDKGYTGDHGSPGFRWGAVAFPTPPARTADFGAVVEWETGPWWPPERVERVLSEMNPLHRNRIEAMIEAGERRAATAYRRRRNGRSVYEVRSDGVAGCLRAARGGSSTQIVVVVEGGDVRMRLMTLREYARLQGAEYQEALDRFSDADLRTAFGDAVCVPAVTWVARHAFDAVREKADERVSTIANERGVARESLAVEARS